MKSLLVPILFALTVVGAPAQQRAKQRDVIKADVIGVWRGLPLKASSWGESEEKHRDTWVIERRSDGTFRIEKYRFDRFKKLYFVMIPLTEGTWNLKDSVITQRLLGSNTEVSEKLTRVDENELHWVHEGSGIPRSEEFDGNEFPMKEFQLLFGKGSLFGEEYKKVPKEEFEKRYEATKGEPQR
jgi:hypothetical protein